MQDFLVDPIQGGLWIILYHYLAHALFLVLCVILIKGELNFEEAKHVNCN